MTTTQMGKRGQVGGGVFSWLIAAGLGLITVALLFSFSGDILATVQADQTADTVAYNVTGKGLDSLTNVGNYLPTIGLVVAVGAILVILFAVIARIQR